ncbi:MAG: hypothetical protein F9K35_10765 [Burkholderiaceae bacterium]|nr:MAG: hypothetical protein F9K35_10765 [Burkholderiaceae bacterium]
MTRLGRLAALGGCAAVLWGAAGAAQAQAYVNGSVSGQIAPGVYGRVDIGNGPPPALIYQQPMLISPPAVVVPHAPPVYMYVPPGHAKHWGKHCARYNACGQQVYFLRNPPPRYGHGDPRWRDDGHRHRDRDHWDDDRKHGRGHGHGHGKGHGRHDD